MSICTSPGKLDGVIACITVCQGVAACWCSIPHSEFRNPNLKKSPLFLRSLRKTRYLDVKYLVKYGEFSGIRCDKLRKIRNLQCEMNRQNRLRTRKINGL